MASHLLIIYVQLKNKAQDLAASFFNCPIYLAARLGVHLPTLKIHLKGKFSI
jgi:hypothetical protein